MSYACGYIPHVLLERYEVRDGNVVSQYVECLGNMAVEGDELMTYLHTQESGSHRLTGVAYFRLMIIHFLK